VFHWGLRHSSRPSDVSNAGRTLRCMLDELHLAQFANREASADRRARPVESGMSVAGKRLRLPFARSFSRMERETGCAFGTLTCILAGHGSSIGTCPGCRFEGAGWRSEFDEVSAGVLLR
jgi:hypothetical protein